MADSMDKKYSNVPNLSYQSFFLGDLAEIITKGTTPHLFVESGINFIKIESIDSRLKLNNKLAHITKGEHEGFLSRSILKENDILFSIAGALGLVYIVNKNDLPANTNQALSLIRIKNKNLVQYISWFLESEKVQKTIREIKSIGAQPNLSLDQVRKFKINIPKDLNYIDTTTKLLNLLEEKIDTQNKIIRTLFNLKRGLCQIIKEKQKNAPTFLVKDICKIGRGRVISKAEIEKAESHTYPVFSSQTSNNGVMGYIDSYDFDGEYLTWTTDGANAGTVFYHNEKFNCTNVCGTLKITNKTINPYFLYLILENASQKYVSKNLANPKLMNDTMANIKINIPDFKCQNDFVNVCKAIEKRTEVEKEILRLLLDKKKFLLSNLFI